MTVASLCLRSVIVQVAEIVGIDHPRIFAIVDEVGPVVSIVNGRGTQPRATHLFLPKPDLAAGQTRRAKRRSLRAAR